MTPHLHTPDLAGSGRLVAPMRPSAPPAAPAVLQRQHAPGQLSLPLRPRG